MKEIQLTQGKVAIVDDEDYEKLSKHKWYALKGTYTHYARRDIKRKGNSKIILMHQEIMNNLSIDHINHNGLDNRRHNLRLASCSQNRSNTVKHNVRSSSKYKGVSWHKNTQRWQVRITVNYAVKSLGYFHVEEEAARTYNIAALLYFGEFAQLNRF